MTEITVERIPCGVAKITKYFHEDGTPVLVDGVQRQDVEIHVSAEALKSKQGEVA